MAAESRKSDLWRSRKGEREKKPYSILLVDPPAQLHSPSQGVALAEKGLVPLVSAVTSAFKVQKAGFFWFFF